MNWFIGFSLCSLLVLEVPWFCCFSLGFTCVFSKKKVESWGRYDGFFHHFLGVTLPAACATPLSLIYVVASPPLLMEGVGVSIPGTPRSPPGDALQDVHLHRELALGGL